MSETTPLVKREEFGAQQITESAETSMSATTARETAIIQAEYIMAERHRRNWMDVRARMLDHCRRPRFASISRYCKPVGKKFVNGEWIEEKARGWSARFAEVLAQEMGNIKPWSQVTYEDAHMKIVRVGVTDLEKNLPRSREISFMKVVEKRGRRKKGSENEWDPPEGRDVLSVRLNSKGEPVYLCRATEDEMRAKVNSEESKTQRDFIVRLCPRDILDDCEDEQYNTVSSEDARDPKAALKRVLDGFQRLSVMPSDLVNYLGHSVEQVSPAELQELRELWTAINDGQTTFREALKVRFSPSEDVLDETREQRDARHLRQIAEQTRQAIAQEKIARLGGARKCGTCGQTGHDSRNCPAKEVPPAPNGNNAEVREFPDLPDPLEVRDSVIRVKGAYWVPNEDYSAWKMLPEEEALAKVGL